MEWCHKSSFAVTCDVGQVGILSPVLFSVYVDELIELLRDWLWLLRKSIN